MIFADIPDATSIFVDANAFVYALAPDPQFGPPAGQLLERVERGDLLGFTSSHCLSDAAHRLMCLEACATFQWPFAGIANRLKHHAAQIQQLNKYRQAMDAVVRIGMQTIVTSAHHVLLATAISQQYGLLSGDALIVVLMQESGLAHVASNDADFDRVPGITRCTRV